METLDSEDADEIIFDEVEIVEETNKNLLKTEKNFVIRNRQTNFACFSIIL